MGSLIPEGSEGEALNYGQGEGQWRIGATVWGIYAGDGGYYLQLEEGVLDLREAHRMIRGILARIRSTWGSQIRGEIEGIWHGDTPS
ncbi:hypothetical protein llg_08850 [Luteolibacter sp. LG18]|nr:hypothetical protein llg_08850 [Luteolibacter sp. LG18]